MKKTLAGVLAALALVAGCADAESRRIEETRAGLVGTWLRETQAEGARLRRVMVLAPDGKFVERAQRLGHDGREEKLEFAGEWSYDGTNFKRRYLQENGRQFAGGGFRYATYQLTSLTPSGFAARDHVAGGEIAYQRVADGTQP